jgi:hypothetical protein
MVIRLLVSQPMPTVVNTLDRNRNFSRFIRDSRLFYKILGPLVGGSFALIWATVGLAHVISINQLRDQLRQRSKLLGTTISETALVIGNYAEMRFALEKITHSSWVVYGITLATRNSTVICASSPNPGNAGATITGN